MKAGVLFTITLLVVMFTPVISQEKAAKMSREEKRAEQEKKTEALVTSGSFMFVGQYAMPTGMRQVSLATNPNYVKFQPGMIESQMPFFGQAYSTTGYGTDTGVKFKAKPDKLVSKETKKGWDVDAEVSDQGDRFTLYMSVTRSGSAILTITSNRRASISYNGDIVPIDK